MTAITVARCDGRDITGVRYPPIWAAACSVAVAVGAVPKDCYERQVDRECRLVARVESTGRADEPMLRQSLSTRLPGKSCGVGAVMIPPAT